MGIQEFGIAAALDLDLDTASHGLSVLSGRQADVGGCEVKSKEHYNRANTDIVIP